MKKNGINMTTNWTDGYQTVVNYTYGYYRDLSPNFQKFCLLLNGIDCPENNENHQHCELGFGQGVSLNIHVVSNLGIFYGTDFNPAHAAHANVLAEQSHISHHFYDDSFEELFNRDLPSFDSISLHGIWSWISHENQHIILKFIRKYLKPNGVVYISYNCLTGWAANMPIRELFHSHFKFNSRSTNPVQNVKDSLEFSEALLNQNPEFAKRNPNALNKVQELKNQNPNYLIHEYLNQDWQCFSFQQIVRTLEDIKLSYAGTTNLSSHLDHINFSEEHQQFLKQIEHPIFKEQCKDYFANTQFRKDLFIRGKNNLTPLQTKERLRKIPFIMLNSPEQLPKSVAGLLGSFTLKNEIYEPLGAYFKNIDYAPQSISQIEEAIPELNYSQLINAITILCHLGVMQPCLNQVNDQVIEQAQRFNRYVIDQARYHINYQAVACPFTGIGIVADQFTQLFYRAHFSEGHNSADAFAQSVQLVLDDLNWLVLDKDGQSVSDKQQSLEILKQKAQYFIDGDKILIAKQLKLFA